MPDVDPWCPWTWHDFRTGSRGSAKGAASRPQRGSLTRQSPAATIGEEMASDHTSRRTVLLAGAVAGAGFAAALGSWPGAPRRPPAATASGDRPEPVTPPPAPAPYDAPVGDALPTFKRVAGRFAQALATYDAAAVASRSLPTEVYVGTREELEAGAAPLRAAAGWSRAEVEFVQYGGLTPVSPRATSGVAMVVLRQVMQDASGSTSIVRRTLDLRLRQEAGAWQVERLASAGGTKLDRPQRLSLSAQRVLDDPRIDLPDSARWDIYSGQIAEELLRVMLNLADVTRLRATVLKTGHPERVVDGRASAPVSAHWRGRAVDIYALDDVPIADAAPAVVRSVVQTAGSIGSVAQVGAPEGFDLDGGGRRYFTNLVHADHLHVAVRGTDP